MFKVNYCSVFKFFVWVNIYIHLVFSSYVFMPVSIAYSKDQQAGSYQLSDNPQMTTTVYSVSYGETAESVARKFNIDVETLRQLNQKTAFLKNFDHLQKGDMLLVPMVLSIKEPEGDSRLAGYAQQIGTFLANGGRSSEAQSTATNFLVGKANSSIEQWLNNYGTARLQLNIDHNFSLKNSQFEVLLPLWDDGKRLLFTQGSVHRTDSRIQANLGLGARYSARDYMIGSNIFWDYDISNYHSRMGVGIEYWRDYLKLSANGYFRISSWRSSPDIEDYDERPANGWDVRAEGYLPFYPQAGLKLNYEQYYGNEVALLGKDNRRHNPYAVTFGASYTPFPLMTLNMDHRRGASGDSDTRFGAQLTYKFGVPLKRQLDPDAVNDMRTVAGSRYDLVNRNNNIILEYRRQEVIRLFMANYITGLPGENHSLAASVEAKHGLAHIDWAAPALLAAGGSVIAGAGLTDYKVVLPPYHIGGEEDNTYLVTATATDKRGNVSKQAATQVVVKAPLIDHAKSTFLPVESSLTADDTSAVTLTLMIRDSQGRPADINVSYVDMSVSGKRSAKITDLKRTAAGTYVLTVTAGTDEETVTFTPSVNGIVLPVARVMIRPGSPSGDQSTFTASPSVILADNTATSTLTFVAKDRYGNAVGGLADRLNFAVTDSRGVKPAAGAVSLSPISESSTKGTYTATLKGTLADTYTIKPDYDGASIGSLKAQVELTADGTKPGGDGYSTFTASPSVILADNTATSTLTFVAKDNYGNAVGGIAKQLRFAVTDSHGAKPAAGAVSLSSISESSTKGTYTATLKGTLADTYTIKPDYDGASIGTLKAQVELTADGTKPAGDGHSVFNASSDTILADNTATSTLAFMAKDSYGNAIGNIADRLNFAVTDSHGAKPAAGAVSLSSITESGTKGTYTATLKGTLADTYTIKPDYDGAPIGSLKAQVELTADGTKPGGDGHSTFTASPSVILADNKATSTLTFVAKDNYGNAVGGLVDRLNFTVTDSRGATPAAGAVSVSSISESSTKGTYTATLKGTLADTYTIKPDYDGAPIGTLKAQVALTADGTKPGGDGHSTFTASPSVILADNRATSTLTFVAKDSYGNAVGGIAKQLSFTVTDSRGATPAAGAVSVSSISESSTKGTYTATLKGTLADTYTIKPDYDGAPIGSLKAQVKLTADTANAVVAELKLQGSTVVKTANGTDSFDYVATIKDKNGNRIPDVTVTWFKNTENADFSKQTSTTDANGQATVSLTSKNPGGAMNIQVAAKAKADTKQVNADKTVSFVGYRFVLETAKQVIAVNGTSQYNVIAIPSDNSGKVTLTSGVTWSTSDASVATSVGGGLIRGKSAGTANVIATGTYKGIPYKVVEKITIRAAVVSPVYGDPFGSLEEHIIQPPSYLLATRCGFIVDAVGTLEGITGGPGGDAKGIDNMDKVSAITMYWGKYDHASGITIGKIDISYSDGRPVRSCGRNEGMTDIISQTYSIPPDMILQGVRVNAGQYVRALQWLVIDADVQP